MREPDKIDTRDFSVLSVGYPLFPVHADAAGGAEQIVFLLDGEFYRRNIKSWVIAAEGSQVCGNLFSTLRVDCEIDEGTRRRAEALHLRAINKVLSSRAVDLIHFHGLDFAAYVPEREIPMLATLHLPLGWYDSSVLQQKRVGLNCVSRSQAESTGLPVVLNGIDTSRYVPVPSQEDYMVWLGRVCPEKGVHLALQAAKAAGARLFIAGPVHPFASHQQYFRDEVEPLLDEKRRYLGAVEGTEKLRLLAEAKALLVTSTVAETSSLVAMEAASSGTAVIALRSGALPEVVDHGRTGFIADSTDDLVSYLPRVGEIDRRHCREMAVKRFSAVRMAEDYLALYRRILGTSRAPQEALYSS